MKVAAHFMLNLPGARRNPGYQNRWANGQIRMRNAARCGHIWGCATLALDELCTQPGYIHPMVVGEYCG